MSLVYVKNTSKGLFAWLLIMITLNLFIGALLIYSGVITESFHIKYQEYIVEDGIIYYPLYTVPEGVTLIIVDDVEKWTYSSMLGGGTGASPILNVDESEFTKVARLSGSITFIEDKQYSGLYVYYNNFYYKMDVETPSDISNYKEKYVIQDGVLYAVYKIPHKDWSMILGGVLTITSALFVLGIWYPKKIKESNDKDYDIHYFLIHLIGLVTMLLGILLAL